jgi:hypothetical protein
MNMWRDACELQHKLNLILKDCSSKTTVENMTLMTDFVEENY